LQEALSDAFLEQCKSRENGGRDISHEMYKLFNELSKNKQNLLGWAYCTYYYYLIELQMGFYPVAVVLQ
jgi:hypothetical protein